MAKDPYKYFRLEAKELLDELSNQYLLGYTPTNTSHDGVLRHIKLEVDGQHAVRAREAYRLMALPER